MINNFIKHIKIIIFLLIIAFTTACSSSYRDPSTTQLVVIVLPKEPSSVETYAAKELAYHLEKLTGAKALLRREEAGAQGRAWHFFLGDTQKAHEWGVAVQDIAPNQSTIEVRERQVVIAGGDGKGDPLELSTHAGTLLGIYEFLDKEWGVRWLWPGKLGEILPEQKQILLTPKRWQYTPPFSQAKLHRYDRVEGWNDPEAAAQFRQNEKVWLRRQRFYVTENYSYGHSFKHYWQRFSQTHPRFFNLLPEGRRSPSSLFEKGNPQRVSLNVSFPALHQQIIDDWQARRSETYPWINAVENDAPGQCTCEECLLWDSLTPLKIPGEVITPMVSDIVSLERARAAYFQWDPHWYRFLGSLSDRYARFYLGLLELGKTIDPNAKVVGEAYANRREPPVQTILNEDVVIRIVPALMFPWTEKKQKAFFHQWKGWRASGATLVLRPNYLLDGHTFPIFYAHHLAKVFNFAKQRDMRATDFDSLTGQWATQGANLYTLARLHAKKAPKLETILQEYASAFGPAKRTIREYLSLWEKASDGVSQADYASDWLHFLQPATALFSASVMEKAEKLLDRAALQTRDDSTAAQRVSFLRTGLNHAKHCLAVEQAYRGAFSSGSWDAFEKLKSELDAFRQEHETTGFANLGYLNYLEGYTWKREAAGQ